MRRDGSVYQAFNALTGIVLGSATTEINTSYGASIDTLGFGSMLAVLTVGAVTGTNAGPGDVIVRFEESINATGPYTLIGDGALNGSLNFTTLAVLGNTTIGAQDKLYERLSDTNRKRYIRCRAAVVETAGKMCVPLAVSVLLGEPSSTLYVSGATTLSTGNAQAYGGLYSTF